MPVPTSSDPMGGKLSIEINNVEIPAFMLGSISGNVTQVLRTSERLSGTTTTPSSQLDNPVFDIVFFPNKWSDLQYFFPENYDGTPGQDGGAIIFGSDECELPQAVPVVFHYDCENGETRDVSIPSAR